MTYVKCLSAALKIKRGDLDIWNALPLFKVIYGVTTDLSEFLFSGSSWKRKWNLQWHNGNFTLSSDHASTIEVHSELVKPYSCSLTPVRFEWGKSVFVDGSLLLATRHSSSSCLKNTVTLSKSDRAALVSSSMVRSSFCPRRERKLRNFTRVRVWVVVVTAVRLQSHTDFRVFDSERHTHNKKKAATGKLLFKIYAKLWTLLFFSRNR